MKTPNDLWSDLGEVAEEEIVHVVTKLFMIYEDQLTGLITLGKKKSGKFLDCHWTKR